MGKQLSVEEGNQLKEYFFRVLSSRHAWNMKVFVSVVVRGKMANNLLEYANRIITSISVFIRSTEENIT